jgi:DNA ligase-1
VNLPILYKKSSAGALLLWGIDVDGAKITTCHGHVGGALQTGEETISEGKNLGKANATTPAEQAESEARARHTKQRKRGYVESPEAAQAGAVDAVIEGGILPMLAPNKSYPKDRDIEKAIKFPAFYQPKLDGMRCIAIVEDGVCTLWSRTRKPIRSVPHIVEAYERAFPIGRVVLDGELYNHDFRAEFEELISLLRGDEPDAEGRYLKAEHHVYDCFEVDATVAAGNNLCDLVSTSDNPFCIRTGIVDDLFDAVPSGAPIKRVTTREVKTWDELIAAYEASLLEEYEGGMARNAAAPYDSGKRSKHLQKMKEFTDHEFRIVGMEEGRGKAAGHVGAFICVTAPGTYPAEEKGAPLAGEEPQTFNVTPRFTYARRKELFENPEQWQGKILTVRFKRWTSYKKPYIPTGRAIRDYE